MFFPTHIWIIIHELSIYKQSTLHNIVSMVHDLKKSTLACEVVLEYMTSQSFTNNVYIYLYGKRIWFLSQICKPDNSESLGKIKVSHLKTLIQLMSCDTRKLD